MSGVLSRWGVFSRWRAVQVWMTTSTCACTSTSACTRSSACTRVENVIVPYVISAGTGPSAMCNTSRVAGASMGGPQAQAWGVLSQSPKPHPQGSWGSSVRSRHTGHLLACSFIRATPNCTLIPPLTNCKTCAYTCIHTRHTHTHTHTRSGVPGLLGQGNGAEQNT